jgi:hypothetical protein
MSKAVWIVLAIVVICCGLIFSVLHNAFRNDDWRTAPAVAPSVARNTELSGILYTSIAAPCAVDEESAHSTIAAIRDKDMEAIDGLKERGKVLALSVGTKFEPSGSAPEGFAWGFVRSGRNVGRDCFIPEAWLQTTPPRVAK